MEKSDLSEWIIFDSTFFYFFIYRAGLAGKIVFTQFHFWCDLGILKWVSASDGLKTRVNNWWLENSWKWKEKLRACLALPLPLALVVLSASNAAKHFQWVTIEMIIAVAVVRNLAQNLRDSNSMADMQSKGRKISKQTCLRETMWRFSRVKNIKDSQSALNKNSKLY